ncbi:hypothetical protein GGF46_002512 [Coemansia sp. RSA 552]|nr:hypothetical protein GGF46_002512 [Coemansia sp. RSA 552]
MPFSSAAPELRIEVDAGRGTQDVRGRLVLRTARPVAVRRVRVEFVGEESVHLRAWVALSTTTVSREVARARAEVCGAGELAAGEHAWGFRVRVPGWVPSSVDGDMCRVRYVVRGVVERSSLGGGRWAVEEEIPCRRLRASSRLARKRRIDQSVGCPDGSCHVRVWGSLSRDVVKPGAHVRVDLCAQTSDGRFGIRLLAAHFAECVMCHVNVRGEQRIVSRMRNLVSCRLDRPPEPADDAPCGPRGSLRSDPGDTARRQVPDAPQRSSDDTLGVEARRGHLTRGIRKTRSRLAVLLRNSEPPQVPRLPANAAAGSPAQQQQQQPAQTPPHSPRGLSSGQGAGRRVVRQIRTAQTIQVPHGLSQFASEYVSREYRLVVVAEVAPLEDRESLHDLTRYERSPRVRSESSSESSLAELQSPVPVSEQSSAIAEWKVEVVDHFDVGFDELVSPEYGAQRAGPVRPAGPAALSMDEPEISVGGYEFVAESAPPSPATPAVSEESGSSRHHRRGSSGLVGLLRRGFRSSAAAASSLSLPQQAVLHRHTRSVSNDHNPPPLPHSPKVRPSPPPQKLTRRRRSADRSDDELLLYPLQQHKTHG